MIALRRLGFALLLFSACSHPRGINIGPNPDLSGMQNQQPDGSGPTPAGECTACRTDSDCSNGSVCAQLAGDTYCATTCTGNSGCATDDTCVAVSTVTGDQVSVCVDNTNECGTGPVALDMGMPPMNTMQCGSLVGPTVTASCHSCSSSSSSCQTNGCYGGWWCNTGTNHCQAPPTSCTTGGGSDGGSPPPPPDGGTVPSVGFGTTPTGTVTASGGTISRLLFAVVGDTRPPAIDDTKGYPIAIATQIFTDVQNLSAHPPFVVSTGDYMFATPSGTESTPQIADYLMARAPYTGIQFPAMGNHECSGYTASNCISGSKDLSNNNNYPTFMTKMLGPLNVTKPYYMIPINATDGSWTAKFVFIAGNAWDSGQASWLTSTLAQKTTYTFIVRHEPKAANTAPGVTPSEQIMAQYPYTMAIVGHTHTYNRTAQREVVIGNGGAPVTGGKNYGYGVFSQQPDGSITIDMVDYSTNMIDTSFHFAVKADGSPAP